MYKKYGMISIIMAIAMFLGTGCTLSLFSSPASLATPTILVIPTLTPLPATPVPTAVSITANPPTVIVSSMIPSAVVPPATNPPPAQAVPANFCADGQATALINSFKSAVQTSNGTLLASLVSPVHGMDARFYRDGRVVNYDQAHAKFLFDSTFAVDWGPAPGSGLETKGSFHEIVLPALLNVFNKNYALTCNQVQVGGATYHAAWPYKDINFYSVFFPGTTANGNLDWHTWLVGMEYLSGKPYLYAIMQFQWEP